MAPMVLGRGRRLTSPLTARPCVRDCRPSSAVACAGPWSASEDEQLVELVGQYGGKHWARIASMLPGRTGKQCRERWCNNLDPSLKKGAWTPEEDETILRLHSKLGTRYAPPLAERSQRPKPSRPPTAEAHPPSDASSLSCPLPRLTRCRVACPPCVPRPAQMGGDCQVPSGALGQLGQESLVLDLLAYPTAAAGGRRGRGGGLRACRARLQARLR